MRKEWEQKLADGLLRCSVLTWTSLVTCSWRHLGVLYKSDLRCVSVLDLIRVGRKKDVGIGKKKCIGLRFVVRATIRAELDLSTWPGSEKASVGKLWNWSWFEGFLIVFSLLIVMAGCQGDTQKKANVPLWICPFPSSNSESVLTTTDPQPQLFTRKYSTSPPAATTTANYLDPPTGTNTWRLHVFPSAPCYSSFLSFCLCTDVLRDRVFPSFTLFIKVRFKMIIFSETISNPVTSKLRRKQKHQGNYKQTRLKTRGWSGLRNMILTYFTLRR